MSEHSSEELQALRKRIDELDHVIHGALLERADLIYAVAEEKRKHDLPFVHPAREAQMIRRILKRHRQPFPEGAIARIWRELVGAASLLQIGLRIAVCVEDGDFLNWDLAKSYFGSVVHMQRHSTASTALASVREGEASFAVLPWPQEEDEHPWWPALFMQDLNIHIVMALPFGGFADELDDTHDRALVVSRTPFMDSGEDHSFIALEVDQTVSRARLVDVLKTLGFAPLSIVTHKSFHGSSNSLHFIELDHYVGGDDERIIDFAQHFEEFGAQCRPLGGYPVSPIYKDDKSIRPDIPVLVAPRASQVGEV